VQFLNITWAAVWRMDFSGGKVKKEDQEENVDTNIHTYIHIYAPVSSYIK
jgi:hypothetical protein